MNLANARLSFLTLLYPNYYYNHLHAPLCAHGDGFVRKSVDHFMRQRQNDARRTNGSERTDMADVRPLIFQYVVLSRTRC